MPLGLLWLACGGPDRPGGSGSSSPVASTESGASWTRRTGTIGIQPLRPALWPYSKPTVEVGELVRGADVELVVGGQGPGAEVTFLRSTTGMGPGLCDTLVDGLCPALLDAEVFATAVVADDGRATFSFRVDAHEPTGVVWFQAAVWDPALGRGITSTCRERYVALAPAESPASFTDATLSAGLTETYTDGNSHTGGLTWLDYNGDHWPDLFLSNGGGLAHYLYRNDGDGTFTDVSALVAKPDIGLEDAGAVAADIDNDGDVDLFIPVDNPAPMNVDFAQPREGGPNLLYLNQGDGTFVEDALRAGLVDPEGRRTITASFGDVDNDGFVDLYLGNWAMNALPLGVQDNFGRLLHNQGDRFIDITAAAGGVDNAGLDNLVSVFVDIDQDGDADLYNGNVAAADRSPEMIPDDLFYRNVGGETLFVEDTPRPVGLDAWAAMGIDIGDIDADGDWDLYITDNWETDPIPRGNPLYETEDGVLQPNSCAEAGVCTGYSGWPTNFVDFDRDGWVDLWVGTQFRDDPDLLLMNDRDGTFTAAAVPAWVENAAHGGSVADYDGDGDVDVAVHNTGGDSRLYSNDGIDANSWVAFKLIGVATNRDAIGAMVRVTAGAHSQIRRVSGGESAHSQAELAVHFGLALAGSIDLVEVLWPSGSRTTLTDVPVGKLWFVHEVDGLMVEKLTEATATWSASAGVLSVAARSSFGGRTVLAADGLGTLRWDVESNVHATAFEGVPIQPATVRLVGDRGAVFDLDVVGVP